MAKVHVYSQRGLIMFKEVLFDNRLFFHFGRKPENFAAQT